MRPADEGAPGPLAGGTGREGTNETDAPTLTPSRYQEKTFARLAALAALRGIELHQLPDGRYAVRRWALERVLENLDEARAFLERQGVRE